MAEWRTIESAPHGVRVLLWNEVTGWYISAQRDDGDGPMDGWGGQPGRWYPKPTHWMPLPAPPTGADDAN